MKFDGTPEEDGSEQPVKQEQVVTPAAAEAERARPVISSEDILRARREEVSAARKDISDAINAAHNSHYTDDNDFPFTD